MIVQIVPFIVFSPFFWSYDIDLPYVFKIIYNNAL
jgi:hypothetical protein